MSPRAGSSTPLPVTPAIKQLDDCALCHGGLLQPLRPWFSYRPGRPLSTYYVPDSSVGTGAPDVHGNQIGLLRGSACFRGSPDLSCATCHDVHRPQRDLRMFAEKCLGCHQVEKHPGSASRERLVAQCIDCHMPVFPTSGLQFESPSGPIAMTFRTHRIAVYPSPGLSSSGR